MAGGRSIQDRNKETVRAAFERCARATFRASYHVPALSLPLIGGYGRGFEVTSSHSELVDPFRDGVPGDASAC